MFGDKAAHWLTRYWTIQEVQKDTEGHSGSKWQDAAIPLGLGEQREEEVRSMNM